jgi:hypothetical protein
MKHRGAEADQRRRDQDRRIAGGDAEQQQADKGGSHADRERERLRLLIGDVPDHRLEQRRRELKRQRDHADLREVERVGVLQERIHRRDQRLHRVVEEMRDADAGKHDVGGPGRARTRRRVRQHDRNGKGFVGDGDRLVHWPKASKNSRDAIFLRRQRQADHRH